MKTEVKTLESLSDAHGLSIASLANPLQLSSIEHVQFCTNSRDELIGRAAYKAIEGHNIVQLVGVKIREDYCPTGLASVMLREYVDEFANPNSVIAYLTRNRGYACSVLEPVCQKEYVVPFEPTLDDKVEELRQAAKILAGDDIVEVYDELGLEVYKKDYYRIDQPVTSEHEHNYYPLRDPKTAMIVAGLTS